MPVIVCFSYGLDPDGSFGKANEARCEAAARLFLRVSQHYKGRTWIIVTAGMIPNFPAQKKLLAVMQREWLQKLGVPEARILPSEENLFQWYNKGINVMSTVTEIDAALSVVEDKKMEINQRTDGEAEMPALPFYAVSHWFHLPRILWFGWWHGIYFRSALVFQSTPWGSVATELLKWFVAFVDPFGSVLGKRATQWAREREIW